MYSRLNATDTQSSDTDCLNGGVIRLADGHRLMKEISSQHYPLMTGHNWVEIEMISPVFGLNVKTI